MKSVVTVTENALPTIALELLDVMHGHDFVPDGIVGIATGGLKLVQALPESVSATRFSCSLHRPSTAVKKRSSFGQRQLQHMPYRFLDFLRIVEDWVGERQSIHPRLPSEILNAELKTISVEVAAKDLRRIAVIDDAVDTGSTLACVMDELRRRLPAEVDLRSAVITRTRARTRTLAEPDYKLFELTLYRFPWSFDYKASV